MINRRVKIILLICLGILIAVGVCLLRSSKGMSRPSIEMNQTEDGLVFGASAIGGTFSICEYGLFFLDDGKMQYYDFKAKNAYILCDKANCRHSDEACGAWYDNSSVRNAVGLALYLGKVYIVKLNQRLNSYEILCMEPSGTGQKVIYSLNIGDATKGSWIVSDIANVYYAGGMAWMSVNYVYINDVDEADFFTTQCIIGINLSTGDVVKLGEPSKEDINYEIEFITPEYLVYIRKWNRVARLSHEKFNSAMIGGEFPDFKDSSDPYYEYWLWYEEHKGLSYEYNIYEVSSGEISEFDNGEYSRNYNEYGSFVGVLPKYYFSGLVGSQLVYGIPDYENENVMMYTFDIETGDTKEIIHIKNGGTLGVAEAGNISVGVTRDHKIVCCEYTENETAQIFYYDLASGERKDLFMDDRRITFRMIGETSDMYIGKIESDFGSNVYSISKDAYERGDLKAAIRLNF